MTPIENMIEVAERNGDSDLDLLKIKDVAKTALEKYGLISQPRETSLITNIMEPEFLEYSNDAKIRQLLCKPVIEPRMNMHNGRNS